MNCLIIDDDSLSRRILEKCVNQVSDLKLIGSYENPIQAREIIVSQDIDLLLLDIEMPEMTGLELIDTLDDPPLIILVTSSKEYAVDAFDYNVVDYLVKPIEFSRFRTAVDKAIERTDSVSTSEDDKNHVFIRTSSSITRLNLKEITYIEALGDYIKIYTESTKHILLSTMKSIESKLPKIEFARLHKSYIVRLDKVSTIDGNNIPMPNKNIPVSRTYKNDLISRLKFL